VFRGYLSRVKQYVMQPQSVVRNKECETQLGVCEKRPFYRKLIYLLLSCSIAYLLLQWIADKYTRFVIINRVNINYNLFFFFRRSWYFCSNEARYCHCFLWRDDYFSRQFWNLQLTSKIIESTELLLKKNFGQNWSKLYWGVCSDMKTEF